MAQIVAMKNGMHRARNMPSIFNVILTFQALGDF
jgi:hypothetical protein